MFLCFRLIVNILPLAATSLNTLDNIGDSNFSELSNPTSIIETTEDLPRGVSNYNNLFYTVNNIGKPTYAFKESSETSLYNRSITYNQESGNHNAILKDEGLEMNSPTDDENLYFKEFDEKKREDGYEITEPEQNPYAVVVLAKVNGVPESYCSGSLVTLGWVLTAAHCFTFVSVGERGVAVLAGGNSMEEARISELPKFAQLLDAAEWHQHPWYEDTKGHDVGVVRLVREFKLTKTVRPIRLTTEPWTTVGYRSCKITGFGSVRYKKESPDDKKRKTHYLQVKNPCKCNFRLKQLVGFTNAKNMICTKPMKDFGICSGDSGGGLVCDGKVHATAMLVVALQNTYDCDVGISRLACAVERGFSVFQDICPFLPWINSFIRFTEDSLISKECEDSGQPHRSATLWVTAGALVTHLLSPWLGQF